MMHLTRAVLLLAAVGLVACKGTKEISDPGMEASGKAVGTSSGSLAATPADADESTIQANTQAVGSNFSSLVSQHQAYAAANGADVGELDAATLARAGEDVVTWDGTHLVVDSTFGEEGLEWTYNVDMTFGAGPTTIDGTYDFEYGLDLAGVTSMYSINAKYNGLTFDDAGCAASGSVTVDWSYETSVLGLGIPGATGGADKGTVITEFTACDTVVISGT